MAVYNYEKLTIGSGDSSGQGTCPLTLRRGT